MELIDLLLFAHIAGAIGWVGSNTVLQITGTRTISRGSGSAVQQFVEDIVYLSPRWFIPVGLWTIGFGVALVLEGPYSFGDLWVTIGLTMFVVSFGMGIGYLGPQAERIAKIGASEGPDSKPYALNAKRLLLASRVEVVLLWVTVFVMVIKPG